jgi:hypothetical protein
MMDLATTRARLEEWGWHMRHRPDLPTELGYPCVALGAEAMQKPIERTADEQGRVDRLARAARRSKTRTVEVLSLGERKRVRETVRPMIDRAQIRTSRAARPDPECRPWPEEVTRTHAAIQRLPYDEQQVIHVRYWLQAGRTIAAKRLGVSERVYRDTLSRAEGAVRSYLDAIAA